jgi:hydrogenase-4 transcriptional activator
MPLLLDVWREIGRHLRIDEATGLVAPILARQVPIHGLLVRRLIVPRLRAETVAESWVGQPVDAGVFRVPPASLPPTSPEALSDWMHAGDLLRSLPPVGDPRREMMGGTALAATVGDRQLLAGLLSHEGQPTGVLVVIAKPAGFTDEHVSIVRRLIEPMAVALANDGRVTELSRLQEALEADKRALLSRLARADVADAIVGSSSGLREVMLQVDRVSGTDAPVLLLGETGTGKEVIAREVHKRSSRARGPIERVNCGAIPGGLVDSELFGHERGSFTGAVNARKGWFERADGGTLFLDEIGELPLDAQVRLLRVLQDGTFERVGGQATQHVDVRIVAATHRDPQQMVEAGTFRNDLWFRLNVFPIVIPPLRERPEDIPPLAEHFGWRVGRRLGRGPLAPTAEDIDLLVRYAWPGNVRELAAVIERAAILGNGERLDVAGALGRPASVAPARTQQPAVAEPVAGLGTLDAAMAAHIERTLVATRGRIEGRGGAAELLAINPHTLRARMRKLGVEWSSFRA